MNQFFALFSLPFLSDSIAHEKCHQDIDNVGSSTVD